MKHQEGYRGAPSTEISPRETEHRAIARRIAADGIVLLANDGTLPLAADARVALYGLAARYTFMGGTGSGSVNCRPGTTIDQGLRDAGITVTSTGWLDALDRERAEIFEAWKKSIYEKSTPGDAMSLFHTFLSNRMPAPAGRPITRCGDTDTAIYVIGRIAGEGADRHPGPGDYLLSETEETQLSRVCEAYPKVIVVLNVGGVIDLGFLDRYPVSALVLLSQAGMEGGHALADVLTGKTSPAGRLSETWAMRYEDYPCADTFSHMNGNLHEEKYREGIYVGYRWFDAFEIRPRFPFGFGLSYTSFSRSGAGLEESGGRLSAAVRVTNTGRFPGRDVVFLFAACPDGLRRKERKRLVGFAKTPLLQPGETAELRIGFSPEQLASYHAGRSAWVLDKGSYRLLYASNAEHFDALGTLTLAETVWGERMHRICPLLDALPELQPESDADRRWAEQLDGLFNGALPILPMDTAAAAALRAYTRPAALPAPEDPLAAKLSLEEKACLVCGRPNEGEASFIGDASVSVPGAAAETTSRLKKYGIPPTVLADGPAGVRISQRYEIRASDGTLYMPDQYEVFEDLLFRKEISHEGTVPYWQFCTAIPVGMLLAQTFDEAEVEEIGGVISREMQEYGVTWWLAPGMNIKRNPLCGRNFEYYSEDPLHAGRIAAAVTRGVQAVPGAAVTIKHYACNNQEDNRRGVSAIVSERALREIYLKGFETAVREAQPRAIMTSYNKVNGVHTANSRDLCTVAAREEWGFRGVIMTDWTTTNSEGGSSAAQCIAAGNDLIMPGMVSDIREIMDAVNEVNDQSLDIRALDESCARILALIRELT